jgi:hypothetical protein
MGASSELQLHAMAEAAAQALRSGDRYTVFCPNCRVAYLSGPRGCPRCKGSLMVVDDLEDRPAKGPKFFHHLEFEGKRQSVAAWALAKNIGVATLYTRLRQGWTTERALTTPEGPSVAVAPIVAAAVPEVVEPEPAPEPVPVTEERHVYRGTPSKPQSPRGRKPFKVYTFNGTTGSLGVFARKMDTTPDVLRCRLNQGWSIERAFTEPVHTKPNAPKGPRPTTPQRISHPDYKRTLEETVAASTPAVAPAPAPVSDADSFLPTLRKKLAKVDELDEKKACVEAELAELARERRAVIEDLRLFIRDGV